MLRGGWTSVVSKDGVVLLQVMDDVIAALADDDVMSAPSPIGEG